MAALFLRLPPIPRDAGAAACAGSLREGRWSLGPWEQVPGDAGQG